MTKVELYQLLLTCNEGHLAAINVLLGLNEAFLPGHNDPIAIRAAAIVRLVEQPGGPGLPALESVLEQLGLTPSPIAIRPKPPSILILAANPAETDELQLGKEVEVIKQRLKESERGQEYVVIVRSGKEASATQLSHHILEHEPVIIHFKGSDKT